MARIRTVKPEFWTSEQVMELSPMARLLFIGMWNFCDDRGVHPVAYKTLKAEVYPADDVTASQVEQWVGEMITQGLLEEFPDGDGRKWWHVTGWHHQLINRPTKSRYPEPPQRIAAEPLPSAAGQGDEMTPTHDLCEPNGETANDVDSINLNGGLTEDSLSAHGVLMEDSLTEGKGKEGKGKEGKKHTPQTPLAGGDLDFSSWPEIPSEQVMRDWFAMRRRLKANVSQTVVSTFGPELHRAVKAGASVDSCLAECVTRNWRGFRAEWMLTVDRNGGQSPPPTDRRCECGEIGVVSRAGRWFCSQHEPKPQPVKRKEPDHGHRLAAC